MEIARERYLDDTKALHLTVSLRSRTTEMHSLMTALTPEEREAVADALAQALDRVGPILQGRAGQDDR